MKYYVIAIFILVVASALFLLTGCHKKPSVNTAELEKMIDDYCKSIAEGKYAFAYENYLNSAYKKDISLNDFIKAHEKRKNTLGVLLDKKVTFMTKTSNLFSGLREYQFTYELKYKDATHHELIKLNDEDGKFLIEGTYTSSSLDSLRFMVW